MRVGCVSPEENDKVNKCQKICRSLVGLLIAGYLPKVFTNIFIAIINVHASSAPLSVYPETNMMQKCPHLILND